MNPFLPINTDDLAQRGWDRPDFVQKALLKAGRRDLIGSDPKCLIPDGPSRRRKR